MTKLLKLNSEYGQSVWLDYIDRDFLVSGKLKQMTEQGLCGITSNPTIFHKAVTDSTDYHDTILSLLQDNQNINEKTLYDRLTILDIQMAADILKPVYIRSEGRDGFVSLEVSPHLAFDTEATIKAAHNLWQSVKRPNLMVKIPATANGFQVIEHLIAEGINVNVTLLFSIERYTSVKTAWIRGLSRHPDPKKVASVASFFVSRVDSKIDFALDKIGGSKAKALKGKIAIANARTAYQHFKEIIHSHPFEIQRRRGAQPQRVLWASTSPKNPDYSDVLYIEQLIGPNTVSTMPPETLDAFLDHGKLSSSLELNVATALHELETLDALGVSLTQITQELEKEGIKKFATSYDKTLSVLKQKYLQ